MLNNPSLLRLLEERDLKLIFYPHIELQKELDKFQSPSERIILANWKDYDVQTLLMRCKLLITDYSSVFFERSSGNFIIRKVISPMKNTASGQSS